MSGKDEKPESEGQIEVTDKGIEDPQDSTGEVMVDPLDLESQYFSQYSNQLKSAVKNFNLDLDLFYHQLDQESEYTDKFFDNVTSAMWKMKDILSTDENAGAGHLTFEHIYKIWNIARSCLKSASKQVKVETVPQIAPAPLTTPCVHVNQPRKAAAHLTKMACPTWDGSVRGYMAFRRKFYTLVEKHEDPEWSLARLQQDALRVGSREHLLIRSKTSIHEAWATLDDIFGIPELIKDACLMDLHSLPKVTSIDDVQGLNSIVDNIRAMKEDLDHVHKSSALGESGLAIIMTKIPDKIRRKVDNAIMESQMQPDAAVKMIISKCESFSKQEIRDQMRRQAHGLLLKDTTHISSLNVVSSSESSFGDASSFLQKDTNFAQKKPNQDNIGKRGNVNAGRDKDRIRDTGSKSTNKDAVSSSSSGKSSPIIKCVLHPDTKSHWTQSCRLFTNTSAEEKKKLLSKESHCLRCFRNHKTDTCRASHLACSEPRCKDPSGHHTTLHSVCMAITMSVSVNAQLAVEPASAKEKEDVLMHLGRCTIRPSHPVNVKVSQSKQLSSAMLMYDPGATLSQIVEPLAERLQLKPINHLDDLMMTTAGQTTPSSWGPANLYKVPLYDLTGSFVCVVSCVGVPYIGELDNGTYEKVSTLFTDLNADALLPPAYGPIEILVGNNHAAMFPEKMDSIGNVVWASTYFGEILHGAHSNFISIIKSNAAGMSFSSALNWNAAKVMNIQAVTTPSSSKEYVTPCHSSVDARSFAPVINSVQESCQVMISNSTVKAPVKQPDTTFEEMTKIEDEPICYRCEKCPVDARRKEEDRLIDVYKDCLTYDQTTKRFVCKMPWKQEYSKLPDNRPLAIKHMMSITKSAAKDPTFKVAFTNEFDKMIEGEILVPVSDEDDESWKKEGGKVWYICYFAVRNEASSSTPLRVVMDPTIPFAGFVINSMWEKPPNLIPPIASLIVGFQEDLIPFFLDFKKCYWTLSLAEEESHLHRVVYNELVEDGLVRTFRMSRNSWGLRPAGSLASIAMLMIAEKHKDSYPEVYSIIKNNLYVDDAATSTDCTAHALTLAHDIHHVMSEASFDIKHFVIGTNVDLSNFQSSFKSTNVKVAEGTERVLGVWFHADTDELSINARVNFSKRRKGARSEPDIEEEEYEDAFPKNLTKKQYLSVMASIYDPTGICCAATIALKHEFGKICDLSIGWNEPIPIDEDPTLPTNHSRCKELLKIVYDIKKIRFYRCLRPPGFTGAPSLVIFCDSSQTAFASVAYYNWLCSDDVRRSRLAMAKAKPFPKTPLLTIPKGEMMACVIASRIRQTLVERSKIQFERIFMITDSTIVLSQLQNSPLRYNLWTANRIDEIQRLTEAHEWFHIESAKNVADDATRSLHPSQMSKDSRWQQGEKFMESPFAVWPLRSIREINATKKEESIDQRIRDPRMTTKKPIDGSTLCIKSNKVASEDLSTLHYLLKITDCKPVDRNDNWVKMKRRLARVIYFLENAAQLFREVIVAKIVTYRTEDEFVPSRRQLELAGIALVLQAQQTLDPDPVRSYKVLNPVKDSLTVWRVYGRTKQAVDNPPILLPKGCPLGTILLRYYHGCQHSGADTTLAKMRQYFWLVDGRKAANAYTSRCVICRYLRKPRVQVEMAPKKTEQVSRSPVFQNVTLDLAGPYLTQLDRRLTRSTATLLTGKVWVLVVVCRASQATHLEAVEAYDTENFLAAYQTFVDIRGKPQSVVADVGSQVVSAAGVMEALWTKCPKSRIASHDPEFTKWSFIPSGAHNELGQAERLIQVFKKTMEAVTGTRKPQISKLRFQRLLYKIANMMNDRPLAIGRNNAGKLDADRFISPNLLLLGRSSSVSSSSQLVDLSVSMTKDQYRYTDILRANQSIINTFWVKWHEQVVSTLFPREKWTRSSRSVCIGDIVIIHDSDAFNHQWVLGEICETVGSSDGIVRKAVIKYKIKDSKSFRYVTKSVRDLTVILAIEERE